MQNTIRLVLFISLVASVLGVAAQSVPAPSTPPIQPSVPSQPQQAARAPPQPAAPPPPLSVLLKKLVSFLTVEYQDGDQIGQLKGTAFFVFVEDKRLGEGRGFIYLVTNRHMAVPVVDGRTMAVRRVTLRLNLKAPVGDAQSAEGDLPLGHGLRWYFPQDDAVDLAVMPLAPDQSKFDYEAFPVSLFATKDVIQAQRIAEGDAVLFTGFFYQFPGQKKIEPIVRQGILAMMPDELLETTLHKPGRLYLADVHVYGVNSGAPMFVNLGGFRNGGITTGVSYRLLGVVSGYFYETEDFQLQVATTLTGKAAANSGISTVVPADELKTALGLPELSQQRDAEVLKETKK